MTVIVRRAPQILQFSCQSKIKLIIFERKHAKIGNFGGLIIAKRMAEFIEVTASYISGIYPPDFDLGDGQCNPPRCYTIKSKKGVQKRKERKGKRKKEIRKQGGTFVPKYSAISKHRL